MLGFVLFTGTAAAAPDAVEGEVPAGAHHLLRVSMRTPPAGDICRTVPRLEVPGEYAVRRVPLLGDGVATEFTVTMSVTPDSVSAARCEREVRATVDLGPVSAGRWTVLSPAPGVLVEVEVVPVIPVPVAPTRTLKLDRPQRVGVTVSTGPGGACAALSAVRFTQEGHTLHARLEPQPPVALACGLPTRTLGTASLELGAGTWTLAADGATLEALALVQLAPSATP